MKHEIAPRWRTRVRQHVRETTGEDRDHLLAHDFKAGQSVRLDFPDGSFAQFRYAFYLLDEESGEVAVFTEHCGYHYFPLAELQVKLLDSAGAR